MSTSTSISSFTPTDASPDKAGLLRLARELGSRVPGVVALVDTETSGLRVGSDHLLEVACILQHVASGQIIESRSWLFHAEQNPAESINGIPEGLLRSYGRRGDRHASTALEIDNMLWEADAILAWNAAFDRPWVEGLLTKHLGSRSSDFVPWVCAMEDMRWPHATSSLALSTVALAHGVTLTEAHRALPDTLTMAKLIQRAREQGWDVQREILLGQRPKAMFEALVSYADRDLAKKARFRWDEKAKRWTRTMAREEAARLPFAVREIYPDGKAWADTHTGLRVLVTGPSDFSDEEFFGTVMRKLSPRSIFTGSAPGADALARRYAEDHKLFCCVHTLGEGACVEHEMGALLNAFQLRPELIVAFGSSDHVEKLVAGAREWGIEVVRPVRAESEG